MQYAATEAAATHPGEMLREDFIPDYELTVAGLAEALGVSRQTINELLRGRRAVSREMALRLSRLFGNSAEFWLNAQRAVDLWDAARTSRKTSAESNPCGARVDRDVNPLIARTSLARASTGIVGDSPLLLTGRLRR